MTMTSTMMRVVMGEWAVSRVVPVSREHTTTHQSRLVLMIEWRGKPLQGDRWIVGWKIHEQLVSHPGPHHQRITSPNRSCIPIDGPPTTRPPSVHVTTTRVTGQTTETTLGPGSQTHLSTFNASKNVQSHFILQCEVIGEVIIGGMMVTLMVMMMMMTLMVMMMMMTLMVMMIVMIWWWCL